MMLLKEVSKSKVYFIKVIFGIFVKKIIIFIKILIL